MGGDEPSPCCSKSSTAKASSSFSGSTDQDGREDFRFDPSATLIVPCCPIVGSVVLFDHGGEEGDMHRSINIIAAVGLALGGALGLAGAMVTQQNVQAMLWAIDGAGLVMAAAMLATKYFRTGNDVVAGGFLVFAIGEGVILLSGPAAGLAGSVPAFAAGTSLWGTALLLVSVPKLFAMPIRILGIVSAVLFIVTAARIFWGEQLQPTSTPLPTYAYPVLVATFVGWIWTLWRETGNK